MADENQDTKSAANVPEEKQTGASPDPESYPTPWIKDHAGAAIEINSADGENVIHMRLCTNDPEKEEAADRIISAVNAHATLTADLAKAREALEAWECHYEAMERCKAGGNDGADVYDATEAQKVAIHLTKAIFSGAAPDAVEGSV